jgi:hypothetical protein
MHRQALIRTFKKPNLLILALIIMKYKNFYLLTQISNQFYPYI